MTAVCGDDIPRRDFVPPVRRLYSEQDAVFFTSGRNHPVLPAQVHRANRLQLVDEKLLDIELLQVHERGEFLIGLRLQVEAVETLLAAEDLDFIPGHAFLPYTLRNTEALKDLERALGIADA